MLGELISLVHIHHISTQKAHWSHLWQSYQIFTLGDLVRTNIVLVPCILYVSYVDIIVI